MLRSILKFIERSLQADLLLYHHQRPHHPYTKLLLGRVAFLSLLTILPPYLAPSLGNDWLINNGALWWASCNTLDSNTVPSNNMLTLFVEACWPPVYSELMMPERVPISNGREEILRLWRWLEDATEDALEEARSLARSLESRLLLSSVNTSPTSICFRSTTSAYR